jgi:TolB-like protein/DNA-binding winged helix-turn-helix (wHTH) protein/Tfp pilus assembly protein PilF
MATSPSPGRQVVRFGAYEVDLRAGELRKNGLRIRLSEQPFQVLAVLLEHPGDVVTREELQKRLWTDGTFVDFEQGLNAAMKRLREALGDSPENPRLIETLARRGYRFIGSLAPRPGRIHSLAVLPLENLSGDPEQEYFAEGITEALITTLAKIGALRVVSRTSVMRYKKTHKTVPQIAGELDVDAIVEGTVQRSGDRVRISAQLLDAASDTHLWAESYDRDLREVLALQTEVARAVANEIHVKLTPVDQARFAEARTVDPEAYEAYLKGLYNWNKRNKEGLEKGIHWFQQAIARDPTYAVAHLGLADCLSVLGWGGFVAPERGCGRAKNLLLQALELDRSSGEAHASLAFATMLYDYDFTTAEREFERSIELCPRYATAHQWYGLYLALMGRFEEGYSELLRAVRLDPHSLMIRVTLGFVYWCWRRYDQAIDQFERALEIDPDFLWARCNMGYTYADQSKYDRAIAAGRRAVELAQAAPSIVALLGYDYAVAGHLAEARKTIEQLRETSKQQYVTSYVVARIYAALGEADEALHWLESAYQERAAWMVVLKIDPPFDYLRSDVRFKDLLGRMNFPP